MGAQQVKISNRFQSGLSVGRETNDMRKHIGIRIISCLGPIRICDRFCEYAAIGRNNFAARHLPCKKILSFIIRTIDKIFTFYKLEICKISHHADKKYKNCIGNDRKFPVVFTRVFRCLRFRIRLSFFCFVCFSCF